MRPSNINCVGDEVKHRRAKQPSCDDVRAANRGAAEAATLKVISATRARQSAHLIAQSFCNRSCPEALRAVKPAQLCFASFRPFFELNLRIAAHAIVSHDNRRRRTAAG